MVLPHQRVLSGGPLPPLRQLLRRGAPVHPTLGRLERMDYPKLPAALLLRLGQVLKGGVRAGELRLPTFLGDDVSAHYRRLRRDLLSRAVDVPREGAAEVLSERIRGVQVDRG